jgi:hypothetical protein
MKVENRPISSLKPYEKNAKKHDRRQVDAVAGSIKAFGWAQPLVVDGEGNLIIGHCRLEAARKLGLTEVPVVEMANLTPEQANALRLADNKLNESAWDMKLVIEELKLLPDDLIDLTGFGRDLLIESKPEDDEVPESAPAVAKLGDIFQLGDHRLMCGDSTRAEDVARLMDGQKADMVFTDPPYNVDYGASKNPRHKIRKIENDSLGKDEWESFCRSLFANFRDFSSGDIYMWGASCPEGMKMRLWLTEMGCHWSATIIWSKDRLVLTPANYQRKYEPCFYGWFDKSSWQGSRKETEVWDIKRPSDSKLHPTMKPVELCQRGIVNSCPPPRNGTRPLPRLRLHPHRLRENRPQVLRHGAGPALRRCLHRPLGTIFGQEVGKAMSL